MTCVGRRVALMECFRQAMRRLSLRGRIIATDVTDTSPGYHTADQGILVPGTDSPEYVGALLSAVRRHRVGLLVPVPDQDLLALARHREEFEELGCTVMIGSEEIVSICQDKARTNALVRKAGLAAIQSCTLEEFRRDPFYPCFIKPIHGSAGIGTAIIGTAGQLEAHIGTFGDRMLIQEYVPGQEFTIDVYRSRDGRVRCVVPRQRLIVRSGEVEKGITINDKRLIDATLKLSSHLGDLWGVYCCQCRRMDSGGSPRFFEINPRFGGGAPLSMAAGADLPLYLLQEITGRRITARVGRFKDRLLMLRYDQAVFVPAGRLDSLPGYRTPQFR